MVSPHPLHSLPVPPAKNALTANEEGGNAPSRSLSSVFAMRVPGITRGSVGDVSCSDDLPNDTCRETYIFRCGRGPEKLSDDQPAIGRIA